MYSLEHFLEQRDSHIEIDLYERLPVPWGLVRYGVAPDHPEKKLVADRLFNLFLGRPNVRFFGNVEIGSDITHTELSEWYDAVIYAVGANSDSQMRIPGEDLPGSWAAREFVAWYNGHPDFVDLDFDLSGKRAVIVGVGNVALDVARILTTLPEDLEKTDIADHALSALCKSNIEEVVILGRRSHLHAAYNNPELEELAYLPGVEIKVEGDGLPSESDKALGELDWETERKLKTLSRLAERKLDVTNKRIVFRFLSTPAELVGNGRVEKIQVIRNSLELNEDGKVVVRPGEEKTWIETGLVLRAIGYRGHPFPGLPFDERRGVIDNIDGRVADTSVVNAEVKPGAYVVGWIKRGPQGIIGTNKQCAAETVSRLLADVSAGRIGDKSPLSSSEVSAVIALRKKDVVSESGWRRIDIAERKKGKSSGRPRVKFCSVGEMIDQAA